MDKKTFRRQLFEIIYVRFSFILIIILFSLNSYADNRGTLRLPRNTISWGGKESIDPASPTFFLPVNWILYERLVYPDENGMPTPLLAESWTSNTQCTNFTFKIRKNVQFHNNKPLTAHDIVYTFQHILDPSTESPSAAVLKIIKKFEVLNDHTLVFHLNQSHADFPILLMHFTMGIIPENSADTIESTGIGTGAFKLEKLDLNGTTTLVANDHYWKGHPGLKKIEIHNIKQTMIAAYALLDNKIDYVSEISLLQVSMFKNDKNFTVQHIPVGKLHDLVMNTKVAPFNDVNVRKAFKLVINRDQMLEQVARGEGIIGYDHPIWPIDQYHLKLDLKQNINKAKEFLKKAGYPNGLEISLHVSDVDAYMVTMGLVYKKMAKKAGIHINLELHPDDIYWNEIWMKKPFCGGHWLMRNADQILSETLQSGAKWNESYWENSKFDQLLFKARGATDKTIRTKLYHDIQRLISEEGGIIVPFFEKTIRVLNSNVKGIADNQMDHFIDWYSITKTEP
jgi:peptide/nickel transport system substrate-binding protein